MFVSVLLLAMIQQLIIFETCGRELAKTMHYLKDKASSYLEHDAVTVLVKMKREN